MQRVHIAIIKDNNTASTVLTIPEQPTNGQMLQAVWNLSDDDISIVSEISTVYVYPKAGVLAGRSTRRIEFDLDWWNSPYKRGNENGTEVN